MVEHGEHLRDNEVVHLLTLGPAPYVRPDLQHRFRHTAFFIGPNVREAVTIETVTPAEGQRWMPGRRNWQRPVLFGMLLVFWGLALWNLDRFPPIHFDEATILRLAQSYQDATSWHRRRPPAAP